MERPILFSGSTQERFDALIMPAEKDEIRRLLAAGLSHSQIAPLCNVSVGTVSRVRNSHA